MDFSSHEHTIDGLTWVKDINIENDIITYLRNTNSSNLNELLGPNGSYHGILTG